MIIWKRAKPIQHERGEQKTLIESSGIANLTNDNF